MNNIVISDALQRLIYKLKKDNESDEEVIRAALQLLHTHRRG